MWWWHHAFTFANSLETQKQDNSGWWQYIITFVGSLIVALLSVWIAQLWSTRRERSNILKNLKSEVAGNLKTCGLIYDWLNRDFDSLMKGETALTPYPHLRESIWYSVRGIMIAQYAVTVKFDDAYHLIGIVNDLLRRIEELRYRHIDESMHGFTGEALELSGMEMPGGMFEAASSLNADREAAYKTTYTQYVSVTGGYIKKLLPLLQELETSIAGYGINPKLAKTAESEKNEMK